MTPNLDALAQESQVIEYCISQTPLTLPSHTTMLSGTYPLRHAIRDNSGYRVPEKLELLPEILQANQYATAAFVGAYVLHARWGLNRGFNHYGDDFDLERHRKTTPGAEVERNAEAVLKEAQQWLTGNKEKNFFCFIHLFDPHAPYLPPAPFPPGYAGEIQYTDDQLGKFFRFLKNEGLDKKAIIIITADHGEGLGEHGEDTHGVFLYDTTLHVPLLIRLPSGIHAQRIPARTVVELADIAPTIIELAGLPVPASMQGKSILPVLRHPDSPHKTTAFSEAWSSYYHFNWSPLQAIYKDGLKYIHAPRPELYRTGTDPAEEKDLSVSDAAGAARLRREMIGFKQEHSRRVMTPGALKNDDPGEARKLATLGYLAGGRAATPVAPETLPDPKDKKDIVRQIFRAQELMQTNQPDQALELLTVLTPEASGSADLLMLTADARRKKGDYETALRLYGETLARKPDYPDAAINVVNLLILMGRLPQAESEALSFLRRFPEDYSLKNALGMVYYHQERYAEALECYRASALMEPVNSAAFSGMGEVYLKENKPEAAAPCFEKALQYNPRMARAHFYLGQIASVAGQNALAREHFQKELENSPDHGYTAFLLAEACSAAGDRSDALTYYREAIRLDPQIKLAWFKAAEIMLHNGAQLQEAVALCQTGLKIPPRDGDTLFGYFVITNLYSRLGDTPNVKRATEEGEKLYQELQKAEASLR